MMIPPDLHSVFVYSPPLGLLRNELTERVRRIHASAGTNRQCKNWDKECKHIFDALEGEEVSDCYRKSGNYVRVTVHRADGYRATTFVNPDLVDIKREKRFLKKFLRKACKAGAIPRPISGSTTTPIPASDKRDGKPTSILVKIDGVERELFFENVGCALAFDGCKGRRVTARAVGSRETARIWVLEGPRNNLDNFDGHEDVSFATVAAAG
jgi:hypothetical protein